MKEICDVLQSKITQDKQVQTSQRQATAKLINDVIDDCIPFIEKTAYLEALQKSPHLVTKETDPLRFLKHERWNIWAAAQRTVKYWEWKHTLFGDDRAFRSIADLTGAGALDEHEVLFVRTGFIAILPKDEDGNVYTFMNRSRTGMNPPFESFDPAKKCRLYFYFICNAVDQYYDNRDCSVIVENNGVEETTGLIVLHLISSLPSNPTRNAGDMINEAMPIRFIRMHVIFYPENANNYFSFERYIIPTFLSLNAPLIVTKLSFHYCSSPNEALPKLQQHRIPIYCIPAVLGGSWSYDTFHEWFLQAFLQTNPITNVSQVQQKNLQSTPMNDSYVCDESVLLFDQSSCVPLCSMELLPYLVEEVSKNSNYDNMDDTNEYVTSDDYFDENDIMNESSNTIVPLVNCLVVESNTISTLHEEQLDTPYDRCNDRVESDFDSVSNPNKIFSRNWTDRWSEKYMELCKYREKMGHCLVPQMYDENVTLGAWVKRQRYQYKLMLEGKPSNITEQRIQVLTDIGFVWDSQVAAWFNQLYELQLFKQKFQHCNVPAIYSQNQKLATWVKRQRRQYKVYCENQVSTMTPQRVHELEKLGFEWGVSLNFF